MGFLRNRTVLGVISIVLSLIICFAVTPMFNNSISKKVEIVRVTKDIKSGEQITKAMVQKIEVGGYNLPETVMKNMDNVVGMYATADLHTGDYVVSTKLSDVPAAENAYLYSLDGTKQAMSVTIKTFANGLSGKLQSGDIVQVIAADFQKKGAIIIPPELQYVEVIGVTATTGFDTDTQYDSKDGERELPSTVTLLVEPNQAKILAELEADGKLHLSLVYRGIKGNAEKFIQAQDTLLAELYPPITEEQQTREDGASD